MNTKYIVIAAAASLLSACSLYSSNGKDRCEDQSHCLNGFVCNQATGVCEPEARPDGGGPCVDCGDDSAFVGSAFAVTDVDTAVTLNILDNSIALPGDPLTVVAAGQPANGTASLKPDGSATYTPNAGFVGIDSFEVTVADRAGSYSGTLTVFVRERPAVPATIQRVPVDRAAISGDGRYIAFTSSADDLVPDDTNGEDDVFVLDRVTDTVTRVSVSSDGAQGDNDSNQPLFSMDGRFVAFASFAGNLFPDDINGTSDVLVRDLQTGELELVSQSSDGAQGNGRSTSPAISADGRFVAFLSTSGNLVADSEQRKNLFLRDRDRRTTTLITGATNGTPVRGDVHEAAISADGRFIAFVLDPGRHNDQPTSNEEYARAWLHDTATGRSVPAPGAARSVILSADGRWLGRNSSTFFLTDLIEGSDEAVLLAADGVSQPTASAAGFSGDRRFIAFGSKAGNFVAGDSNNHEDAFVRDFGASANHRVSVAADGTQSDAYSAITSIAADGRWIVFWSAATNLVADNQGTTWGTFVVPNPAAD